MYLNASLSLFLVCFMRESLAVALTTRTALEDARIPTAAQQAYDVPQTRPDLIRALNYDAPLTPHLHVRWPPILSLNVVVMRTKNYAWHVDRADQREHSAADFLTLLGTVVAECDALIDLHGPDFSVGFYQRKDPGSDVSFMVRWGDFSGCSYTDIRQAARNLVALIGDSPGGRTGLTPDFFGNIYLPRRGTTHFLGTFSMLGGV